MTQQNMGSADYLGGLAPRHAEEPAGLTGEAAPTEHTELRNYLIQWTTGPGEEHSKTVEAHSAAQAFIKSGLPAGVFDTVVSDMTIVPDADQEEQV